MINLVKPFSVNELQARVRALLRRCHGVATPVLTYRELSFDPATRTASISGHALQLSLHELSVLEVLVRLIRQTCQQGATGRADLHLR